MKLSLTELLENRHLRRFHCLEKDELNVSILSLRLDLETKYRELDEIQHSVSSHIKRCDSNSCQCDCNMKLELLLQDVRECCKDILRIKKEIEYCNCCAFLLTRKT